MSHDTSHYREGAAQLELGDGFFRPESRPSRDLSVLMAAWQLRQRGESPCRWLDLMAGCGIRSVRWGLEALPAIRTSSAVTLTVNDADAARQLLLQRNLAPLRSARLTLACHQEPAEVLLRRAYLDQHHFDLIDLDAFGCPNGLLQASLQALAFDGVLLLASTDGRSPTGHDRVAAVRKFAAAARTHPASWEVALRLQLAVLAREAWMLGRGLEPLACFSDGRTFRLAVRMRRRLADGEEQQLGLLARCARCGAQAVQPLLRLQGWPSCACEGTQGRWAVTGPLWLGPLQSPVVISELLELADALEHTLAKPGRRLLQRLQADPGLPVCCWSTAELARRLQLQGPPSLHDLVGVLQASGYQACASGVMAGQLRTDAPLDSLLQVCRHLGRKDR
nr:N2,N2-dimethylguanosine tRNA methyltransferase [Synechococcus sp. UW105]